MGIRRHRVVRIAIFALCAFTAFAQRVPNQEAVVVLANVPTAAALKQMTTVVKTAADVLNVSFDEAHSSFALKSPANQLGLAEWLLHAMDKPAGWKPTADEAGNLSARQYVLQPGGDRLEDRWPITRIHYLNTSNALDVVEIVTVTRVVAEIQRVFQFDAAGMIVFRDTATRADLGDWLIGKLDVPADGKALAEQQNNPQAEIFTIANGSGGSADDLLRVFYLDPVLKPADIQARTKSIRETTKTLRVFQKTSPPTIVVRGSSTLLAQAQQIIEGR
jgi:hypothetical protein